MPFLRHEYSFAYWAANAKEGIADILRDDTAVVVPLARARWDDVKW